MLVDLGGNGTTNVVRAEYGYPPGSDQVMSVRQPATGLTGMLLLDPMIGSVRGVAAWANGAMIKDYRTTLAAANPWGTTPADTGAVLRFRWAGREYDQETGLYYMRARYYDPQLGRFLSEDPIGVEGGLNLYGYAGNDPVDASDPTGLVLVCTDGPLVYEYSYWEDTPDGRRQVNVWTQWQNCYDTDALGQGGGDETGSNKGMTKPNESPDDPGKCDAAPAVGLGWTAWGSVGRGPIGAGGV